MTLHPKMDCFIEVPETTLPNGLVVGSFLVSQFLCSPGKIDTTNGVKFHLSLGCERQAASVIQGIPWTMLTYFDAAQACKAAGYSLLTESQWLAIAWDCAGVDANWTKGKRGKGDLIRGLTGGDIAQPQPVSYTTPFPEHRRWLFLSNGEMIFDFGGNARHWVFDDIHGNDEGIVAAEWIEIEDISRQAPAPPYKRGTGRRPDIDFIWLCQREALVRGGCWKDGSSGLAGIFALDSAPPMYAHPDVGFRCTKPISQ